MGSDTGCAGLCSIDGRGWGSGRGALGKDGADGAGGGIAAVASCEVDFVGWDIDALRFGRGIGIAVTVDLEGAGVAGFCASGAATGASSATAGPSGPAGEA